jgi:riboflavin synthase
MFTGIIETVGQILDLEQEGLNTHFQVKSDISGALKVDQSVSHDGVCLTVTKAENGVHWVTAVDETLKKTNLASLKKGSKLNLERCMLNNGRFDGHIVQGHVDQIGKVVTITEQSGSWLFDFEYNPEAGNVTVEKGSIAVNGASLTCFNSTANSFRVAIIPYTFEHTNFNLLKIGDTVNLEFDIIGKYVKRLLAFRS